MAKKQTRWVSTEERIQNIADSINNGTVTNLADIDWRMATDGWQNETAKNIIDKIHDKTLRPAIIDVMLSEWSYNRDSWAFSTGFDMGFSEYLENLKAHIQMYDDFNIETIRNRESKALMKLREDVAKLNERVLPHYSKDDEKQATIQFERLVRGGYFPSGTLLNDWLYIYGINGKEPNTQPLNWQKTQIELGYMVQTIWQDTDSQKLWAICEGVFTVRGKRPNTNTIKSTLSSIENGYKTSPKSFNSMDEVLRI